MNVTRLIENFIISALFVITILFSINNHTDFALLLSIISSILLIFWVKNSLGNYTNISLFFIGFSVLYGLSGPINVTWGEGLHSIFSKPYNTNEFLVAYAIANIGFINGFSLYSLISKYKHNKIENESKLIKLNLNVIYKLIALLAIIATIFEIINLIRVGGIMTLFRGKAYYQGLIATLFLTLPSDIFMNISFCFLGLYIGILIYNGEKIPFSKILIIGIVSSPYIMLNVILGKRGVLVSLFLFLFIGITYFRPIKRIKPKLVLILITAYVFMTFLYANRAIVPLLLEDRSAFMELAFKKERMIKALNPGVSEFGAAFGNYSEFYTKYRSNFSSRLGETYVKGLVVPIPSFIYPGEKPIQITYEFRDEFFISEASRSSIASTGFSSILEAYMNFNYIGIFLVYLAIGYFLQKMDRYFKYKSLSWAIMYISSFSFTLSFHRSAFGDIFGTVFLRLIVLLFFMFFMKLFQFKNESNRSLK